MANVNSLQIVTRSQGEQLPELRLMVPDASGLLPGSAAVNSPRIKARSSGSGLTGQKPGSLILGTDGDIYKANSAGTVSKMITADDADFGSTGIQADIVAESTTAAGVTVDGVLLKDGGVVLADAAVLEVDTINEATSAAGVTVDGVLLKDGGATLPDDGVLQMEGAGTSGKVIRRLGASTTEGLETLVFENTISPNAVETAVFTVPAGAVILAVQANVETALTGGGTTVTFALGTTGDPDKYGYPGSDTLAQNAKIDTIPDWAVLSSAEAIVLTGAATGGTADGDTALTVGSVRVRIVYEALNSLDDA